MGGTPTERKEEAAAEAVVPMEEPGSAEAGAAVEGQDPSRTIEGELPPLEDLVKRIPQEMVAAMDDLFRARWTGVRRLQAGDLK